MDANLILLWVLLLPYVTVMVSSSQCVPPNDPCLYQGAASDWANKISILNVLQLRARFYILSSDEGLNSTISFEMAKAQIDFINSYLMTTKLRFTPEYHLIRNSSLLTKRALPFCNFSLIGDGKCDYYCNSSITNFDGGDCFKSLPDDTGIKLGFLPSLILSFPDFTHKTILSYSLSLSLSLSLCVCVCVCIILSKIK